MKNTAASTTNWSNFGIYRVGRKALNANTHRQPAAGKPVYVAKSTGLRLTGRRKADIPVIKRAIGWLDSNLPTAPKPEPVKWSVRLVTARIKTANGRTLNRVCRVKGSNGVTKVFVTKKAALAWVAGQK